MKKIWMLIAVITVISCKTETPIDYAIVSGKITNLDKEEISINSFNGANSEKIKISEDGSFVDTLTWEKGAYILYDGKNRVQVYLEPGNSIDVSYDAADFDNSLSISGLGSETSVYLLNKSKKQAELMGEGMAVYELEEDDYIAKFNEIKIALTELVNESEGLSEDFKAKEIRNLNYEHISKMSIYERYHSHFAKKPDFKASAAMLDVLKGLDYTNEEDFMFSNDYKSLVSAHYRAESMKLKIKDSLPNDIAYLKTVAAIEQNVIKNDLLFESAKYGITYTEDLKDFYDIFIANSTNEENNKVITESYNKLLTVAKGEPSPKFVNYENYAGGTTSLDDLKGKFVYVDVWATWCGPCLAEIPFLKEVEKQYHDKNIAFVSLSIDKAEDHEKWKAMIAEKELGGIQVFADKDWESDFVQDYLIKGIPRFILIDPQGNIVSSNAPRPSSPKLIEMFNENNI
jgi:thiol-disulfide isomerase/thioredoxin